MPVLILRSPASKYATAAGALIDGASYNFTSNDSISAPPTVWFGGGKNGIIDAGTPDAVFLPTDWNRLSGSSNCNWKWKTDRLRNRSRALRYSGQEQGEPAGNARGTMQYRVTAGYQELYLSYNFYWQIHPSFNDVQWKMFRHLTTTDHDGSTDNGFGSPEVVDGNSPSAYWSNSTLRDNSPYSQFTAINPNWTFGDSWNSAAYNNAGVAPQNGWYRLEHYFRENSNTSTSDGVGTLKFTNTSGTTTVSLSTTNRLYRGPNDYSQATRPFKYFVLQNYFGNSGGTSPGGNEWGDSIIWFDDPYIATAVTGGVSPLRRVEISDGVSEPVIQKITAASGTSRTIELNLGHLATFSGCTLREYSDATTVVTTVSL